MTDLGAASVRRVVVALGAPALFAACCAAAPGAEPSADRVAVVADLATGAGPLPPQLDRRTAERHARAPLSLGEFNDARAHALFLTHPSRPDVAHHIRTCAHLEGMRRRGWYARTTYDMSMLGNALSTCAVLVAARDAEGPAPAPDDRFATLADPACRDALAHHLGEPALAALAPSEDGAAWSSTLDHTQAYATELAWLRFDGRPEALLEVFLVARGGTMSVGVILAIQRDPTGFEVRQIAP